MNNDGVYFIRGKGHWMKILGNPVDNYAKDGKEWTMELEPDKEGLALLKKLGIDDRVKDKKDDKPPRILFRQRLNRADGTENKPITVVDANNRPWDDNKLIGNESVVDVKFKFKDYGRGKQPGVYPQAVRILEHVEYQRQEFAPLSSDDEFFRENNDDTFNQDFGLEDSDLNDDVDEVLE